MHDADNEVTQEDLAAVDTIGGHMASYYEFGQSDEYAAAQEAARDFRLASIEAACREKEDERVALWNKCRDLEGSLIVARAAADQLRVERDQLRAKLDEALRYLKDYAHHNLHCDHFKLENGPYGLRHMECSCGYSAPAAFLASAPEPEADAGPVAETDAPTKVLHYNRENPPDEIVYGALAGRNPHDR